MKHVPELDGVRGLALGLVWVFHYVASFSGAVPGSALAYALAPLRLTWSGVDLFFVLSGFLIGGILIDNRAAANYYRVFYLRRAARIAPLYYTLLGAFVLGVALYRRGHLDVPFLFERADGLVWYGLFLQNVWMAFHGAGLHAFSASWSVAVEEQFYLTLPLLIRRLPNAHAWTITLLAVICTAVGLRTLLALAAVTHWQDVTYLLLPTRMDALALGVLLAIALRSPVWSARLAGHVGTIRAVAVVLLAGLAALTAVAYNSASLLMTSVGYTWIALFYVTLIAWTLLDPRGLPARVFRLAPMRWFGTRSYGLYLLHIPMLGLLHAAVRHAPPLNATWAGVAATAVAAVLTAILAEASFRWFERPLVNRARHVVYSA